MEERCVERVSLCRETGLDDKFVCCFKLAMDMVGVHLGVFGICGWTSNFETKLVEFDVDRYS